MRVCPPSCSHSGHCSRLLSPARATHFLARRAAQQGHAPGGEAGAVPTATLCMPGLPPRHVCVAERRVLAITLPCRRGVVSHLTCDCAERIMLSRGSHESLTHVLVGSTRGTGAHARGAVRRSPVLRVYSPASTRIRTRFLPNTSAAHQTPYSACDDKNTHKNDATLTHTRAPTVAACIHL